MAGTSIDLSAIRTDATSYAGTFRALIGAGVSSFDGAYSSLSGVPSSFTPSSHAHGNITNDGAIGSTANLPLITTTSGVITVGSFGTTANTFCQGNDSRLSDARTPTSHVHGNITNAGAIGSTANLPVVTTTSGVLTTATATGSLGSFVFSVSPTFTGTANFAAITTTGTVTVNVSVADTGISLTSSTNPRFNIVRGGVERLRFDALGSVGTIGGSGNGLNIQANAGSSAGVSFASGGVATFTHNVIAPTFQIGSSSGPLVKNSSGVAEVRNAADSAYAQLNSGTFTTSGSLIVTNPQTPASASAAGTVGTIAWDSTYFYVCIATNTWRRVAHATW